MNQLFLMQLDLPLLTVEKSRLRQQCRHEKKWNVNQIDMPVLGLAGRHFWTLTSKNEAGTSRWSAVLSACTVADSLDHRTQYMDGPPAGSKFVVQNQEIKKSQNGLKFYISSDVPHTRPAAARLFCATTARIVAKLLYVPWVRIYQWNQNAGKEMQLN